MNVVLKNDSTWKSFEEDLARANSAGKIVQEKAPSRFFSLFTKNSSTNDKVIELAKRKLVDHLETNFGIQYTTPEQVVDINSVFKQLMVECGVTDQSLKTVGEALKIFQKIDQNVIEGAGTLFPTEVDNLDFQSECFRLYATLTSSRSLAPKQEMLAEIHLGNLLALYPYSEPAAGTTLQIPQKIQGQWKMVSYQVEHVALTPAWLSSPIPALALKPEPQSGASPLLLFRGTPVPPASGVLMATLSNIIPGRSAGEITYGRAARERVKRWIDTTYAEFGKVKIYGHSMGGSLSLLTATDNLEHVGEVHAYGSPALNKRSMRKYEAQCEAVAAGDRPQIHIYWNDRDLIPLAGAGFHRDWHLHKVFIPTKQGRLQAHMKANIGGPKVLVMKINSDHDRHQKARKTVNAFHGFMSGFLLPVTGILTLFSIATTGISRGCSKAVSVAKGIFRKTAPSTP